MVKYDKLWKKMESMGLFQSDLFSIMSAPTISALKKNQYVKLSTIENLCKFLECGPGDIMEFDDDMRHVSWRIEEGCSNRFIGKEIIPASEMLEKE